MATDIVIPEAGESVTSGVIAAWRKDDGSWVERDEPVVDVETDKITVEVLAPAAGVLKHAAAEGDEVDVGAVIGTVDESAEKPAGGDSGSEKQAASEGGETKADKPAATTTETKPTESKPTAPPPPATSAGASSNGTPKPASNGPVRATPLAEKIAAERGVDLSNVIGTGASGRIREQDVLAFVQSHQNGAAASQPTTAAPATGSREVTLERMSPLRQKIASRLVEAQQTAAMLTTFNECDMSAVMELRKKYKEPFGEKHSVGLGFMSFFVKAVCSALRAFPKVNSYIVTDDAGKPAMQGHEYCDVAIAVSSPKGLVVPVLRSAEAMSFAGVESAIKDFGMRAKEGKLDLAEMQGGTFTITNGGIFGSLMSTPILNPPQSAILGMHAIKPRAIEHPPKSGQVAIRPMMYLALSYDHRIVDGAEAVSFLVHIKDAIEAPERLMLEL
ncbi:MAG: 2-oxoglutarate dehydrogenase complex dihydrolipoyllysine-residue succinyltransferase [Planctomycetota bacterium]